MLLSDISPFQCHKQLILYSLRHLRQGLTFHHYTFQMWVIPRRKMATWVIFFVRMSRLRSKQVITTLGSKPYQWQSKRRQDITDLKPQAIYQNPLRPWVWVSSVSESSKVFFLFFFKSKQHRAGLQLFLYTHSGIYYDFKGRLHIWHHPTVPKPQRM